MKIYCQSCGSPNEYTSQRPNYCGECGEKFYYAAASTVKPSNPTTPKASITKLKTEDDDETELDETTEIPNIESIAADIDTTFHRKTSLKDALYEKPTGIKIPTQKLTKKQQKELLQQTLNEGATMKRGESPTIGGNEKGDND